MTPLQPNWRASITRTRSEAPPAETHPSETSPSETTPSETTPPETSETDEPEAGPLRRCVVTRERDYRPRMIRFVVAPDRTVHPDLLAKLPGRGIWLSARRDVLETARTRGAFARAAKGAVSVPPDLTSRVEAGLVRRITELLGLARRAGQAVCGFQKAREWLHAGRAALVIQASDGSQEERARFLSGVKDIPVATPLPAEALGAVFGRDHGVHIAIANGRLAEALGIEIERLAGVAGKGLATEAGKSVAGRSGPLNETKRLSGQAGKPRDGTVDER